MATSLVLLCFFFSHCYLNWKVIRLDLELPADGHVQASHCRKWCSVGYDSYRVVSKHCSIEDRSGE